MSNKKAIKLKNLSKKKKRKNWHKALMNKVYTIIINKIM